MKISSSVVVLIIVSCIKYGISLCKNENNKVECESVDEISRKIISQIPNINQVIRMDVHFNPELAIYPKSFESAVVLKDVVITNNNINKLYSHTFQDIPVRYLNLGYNSINIVYPGAFSNLPSLQELRFENNNLKEIPKGVFTKLTLKHLVLSKNQIETIEDKALEQLPNLKKLYLDGNKLESIVVHRILTYPQLLENLWLHNNSLTTVTNYMLQKLRSLKILKLESNSIFFIEPNSFEQTPKLWYLVLSHNQLKEIDGGIFPRTRTSSLENLYIDHNRLMFLSSNFFVGLGNLKRIAMAGNPWFCSCLNVVQKLLDENNIIERCNEEYSSGKRPVCVSGDVGNTDCIHSYNDDLSDKYETYRKDHPLPKKLCIL